MTELLTPACAKSRVRRTRQICYFGTHGPHFPTWNICPFTPSPPARGLPDRDPPSPAARWPAGPPRPKWGTRGWSRWGLSCFSRHLRGRRGYLCHINTAVKNSGVKPPLPFILPRRLLPPPSASSSPSHLSQEMLTGLQRSVQDAAPLSLPSQENSWQGFLFFNFIF